MPMPPLRRVRNADDGLRQAQDAEDLIFKYLASKPIIDGNFIPNVLVTTSGVSVDHRLSRPIKGWIIAGKDAGEDVWSNPTSTPSSTLNLESSGDVTINLWVF
jgi:hypothetical protein